MSTCRDRDATNKCNERALDGFVVCFEHLTKGAAMVKCGTHEARIFEVEKENKELREDKVNLLDQLRLADEDRLRQEHVAPGTWYDSRLKELDKRIEDLEAWHKRTTEIAREVMEDDEPHTVIVWEGEFEGDEVRILQGGVIQTWMEITGGHAWVLDTKDFSGLAAHLAYLLHVERRRDCHC